MAKKIPPSDEEIARLRRAMEEAELDFANAKLAYYHQSEYKGEPVQYEHLAKYAENFIAANYAFQKARFGKVNIKLSVPRLMRE